MLPFNKIIVAASISGAALFAGSTYAYACGGQQRPPHRPPHHTRPPHTKPPKPTTTKAPTTTIPAPTTTQNPPPN